MRIPEALFPIINRIVRLLMRSPLHGLMSASIMVVHYRGRKSGRDMATPVRYHRVGPVLRCMTADHVQWWRNVAAQPEVSLRVAGRLQSYTGSVLTKDPAVLEPMLREFLHDFPQDAVYQNIRLNKDKSLNEEDLAQALKELVIVEFEPIA